MNEIDFIGAFAEYMYKPRDVNFGTDTELVVKPFRNQYNEKCIYIEASMPDKNGKLYRTANIIILDDNNHYSNAYISACISDVLKHCRNTVSDVDNKIVRGYNVKTDISICDGKIAAPLLHAVGGCERCWSEFYVRDDEVTEPKTRVRCPHCGFVQDKVIRKYTDGERLVIKY